MEVEHPLIGTWWDVTEQREVSWEKVVATAKPFTYVLLGEKHDNPDHHWLQAQMLKAVIEDNESVAIGFEMLNDPDKLSNSWQTTEEFASAVDWNRSGWPDFSIYEPIFRVALDTKSTIVAANPSSSFLMTTMQEGWDSIPQKELATLGLDVPLPEAAHKDLEQAIITGHCGYTNPKMTAMMVIGQRLKDAWMARQLVRAESEKKFLIAGNGHIRKDRGVGFYLPPDKTISIASVEVSKEKKEPVLYDTQGADFLFFTPRVDNSDPCEKYRKKLEKMKSRQSE